MSPTCLILDNILSFSFFEDLKPKSNKVGPRSVSLLLCFERSYAPALYRHDIGSSAGNISNVSFSSSVRGFWLPTACMGKSRGQIHVSSSVWHIHYRHFNTSARAVNRDYIFVNREYLPIEIRASVASMTILLSDDELSLLRTSNSVSLPLQIHEQSYHH